MTASLRNRQSSRTAWLTAGLAALLLVLSTRGVRAEEPSATEFPRIELMTMGIGSLMWERHGHIALCVAYADSRRDRCYNYGVANFADPVGMGTAFFRGKKSFWVDAVRRDDMMLVYTRADRTVWSQLIPLTQSQKRQVIAKLRFDVKKENRYYAYDHFWDNCTTRVRDILDDAMGGALKVIDKPMGETTIRDYARKGFLGMQWALVITDLFMGRVTDQVPTFWERMYLPEYLRLAFQTEFDVKPVVLYQRKGPPHPEDGPSGRFAFFLLILLLTAPAWATRLWGRFERLGLAVAVFPPALLGLFIWVCVVGSPVIYLRWTEMFVIFVPLDFAFMFSGGRLVRRYAKFRVASLLLISLLLAVGIFEQPLFVALLWPLIPAAVVAFLPRKAERLRKASAPTGGSPAPGSAEEE